MRQSMKWKICQQLSKSICKFIISGFYQKPDKISEFDRKVYLNHIKKLGFNSSDYIYTTEMRPFIFFYKFLCTKPEGTRKDLVSKHNRLRLWIPDTIIYNDISKDTSFWVYSSFEGYVYRTNAFMDKHVIGKLGNAANPNELVAIVKKVKNKLIKILFSLKWTGET